MTNKEAAEALKGLAEKCEDPSLEAILWAVAGTIYSSRTRALLKHIVPFSQAELERSDPARN